MGDVIPLFGSTDEDSPFAEADDDAAPEPPDARREPPAAGIGPRAMAEVPADEQQLDVLLHNSRIAVSRLTSAPLPEEEMQALLLPFATIQENIEELRRRLNDPAQQGPDKAIDISKDLDSVQKDVQQWIEAVERAIGRFGGAAPLAGLGRTGLGQVSTGISWPWVIAGAAGLTLVGYLVWQSQQPRRRGPLPAR